MQSESKPSQGNQYRSLRVLRWACLYPVGTSRPHTSARVTSMSHRWHSKTLNPASIAVDLTMRTTSLASRTGSELRGEKKYSTYNLTWPKKRNQTCDYDRHDSFIHSFIHNNTATAGIIPCQHQHLTKAETKRSEEQNKCNDCFRHDKNTMVPARTEILPLLVQNILKSTKHKRKGSTEAKKEPGIVHKHCL